MRGGGEAIVDRRRFERESMLAMASESTVKISSLGQKSPDGRYLAPETPFLNLAAMLQNDGPPALAGIDGEDGAEEEEDKISPGSVAFDVGGAGGSTEPGDLRVAPWGGDAAASLEMVRFQ